MQRKKQLGFLAEAALLGFVPVLVLWVIAIDAGFMLGMDMISNGEVLGYAIVLGLILSAVGVWGLWQIVLKLIFPDAYDDSISFHRFHLICGGIGFVFCCIFFVVTYPSISVFYPLPVVIALYLYRKCLKFEQLNYL